MGTELMIPKIDAKALKKVDEVADECRIALAQAGNAVSGSLVVAQAMARLRQAVTPEMMQAVHALQGSAVGFKTDKDDKGGYTSEELTDPFLEATVRGFRMIGNEMNVIARRFYGAKSGFERKVKDHPGLGDWQEAFDFQETVGGTAKVQAIASWTLHGAAHQIVRMRQSVDGQAFDNRIGVRVNTGMGYDAVIGKAKRKLYAQVYDYLIGAIISTPEGEVEEPLDGTVGGSKVKKSGMFDAGPPPADTSTPGTEEVNEALVEEYRGDLASLTDKKDIPAVARKVRGDVRCSDATKAAIFKLCNEAGKGNLSAPATETDPIALSDERRGEWSQEIGKAETVKQLGELARHAADDDVLNGKDRLFVLGAIKARQDELEKPAGKGGKQKKFA